MRRIDPLFDSNCAKQIFSSSMVGPIVIVAGEQGLVRMAMMREDEVPLIPLSEGSSKSCGYVEQAVEELDAYFANRLRQFSVPVDLLILTAFQRGVLEETRRISFGAVCTYGEIAERIRKPNAARAVGGALARNPIAIVIPCHRVVASDGHLRGFSSPHGLRTKARLLQHEGVRVENERVGI